MKLSIMTGIIVGLTLCTNITANNLTKDNKTAYELTALVADSFFNYTHERGATGNMCSLKGQRICQLLTRLTEQTRLFSNPSRDDLKELSRITMVNFRNYDLSGTAADKKAFVQNLINLFQAVLPLLEEKDSTECRGFIQKLSTMIQ